MRYLAENQDDIRQLLLKEPRGNVIRQRQRRTAVQPSGGAARLCRDGVDRSTPSCPAATRSASATVVLETGLRADGEPVTELVLESPPAGLIRLTCTCRDGKVTSVRFRNQPAFVYHLGAAVEVAGLGTLPVDVAWGGMAYVLGRRPESRLRSSRPTKPGTCAWSASRSSERLPRSLPVVHPEHPDFAGITIAAFTRPAERVDGVLTARNAVVVSPGRLDRSPCGTGTSARLAVMHARGRDRGRRARSSTSRSSAAGFDAMIE